MDLALRTAAVLEAGRPASVSGISPPAAAALAAALPWRSFLAVAPDPASASALAGDLGFFLGPERVRLLPVVETVPLERSLPDPDSAAARILALRSLRERDAVVVACAAALASPVPPPDKLAAGILQLKPGQELDRDRTVAALLGMGYRRVPVVMETGDLAVRGGILDLFPPSRETPLRVELWEEGISSLRAFDPGTQRSIAGALTGELILPVAEIPRGEEDRARLAQVLLEFLGSRGIQHRERDQLLSRWEMEGTFPGLSAFLPLLHGQASYPLDHLPPDVPVLVVEPEQVREALLRWGEDARRREAPDLPAAASVYAAAGKVLDDLAPAGRPRLETRSFDHPGAEPASCRAPLGGSLPPGRPDRIPELAQALALGESEGGRLVVAARSPSAAERLRLLLTDLGHPLPVLPRREALGAAGSVITIGSLSAGFALAGDPTVWVAESDLFGAPRETARRRQGPTEWDLPAGNLNPGDVVVHVDHGVARYQGMKQIEVAGQRGDFLHLTFEGGDTLWVPVEEMRRVQPYRSAAASAPPLSRLGGAAWKNVKARIRKILRVMAEELLRLSAERKAKPGTALPAPDHLFREFEASFPWTETPDQEKAIAEVVSDLTAPRAMDRLVCGDVGFGKTEVALRAAFLAVEGGKQVAVLVPTTVLAQQHYQTFASRLSGFPMRVALLSRFVTPREQKAVLADLAAGKVDVVVGTHRLLSPDVCFRDLGLVVVDEEHRFGVRHKEKLKKLKATVDVLTLSATPIPRTLFSALSGLRDLSIIETPPADRKSIHTEVRYFEPELIRDAVTRELDRGGQVFILHNWVRSINAFARMVQSLVPHARVAVAHGQMEEKELERVMLSFLAREHDVLVSTTIIESGLDIPSANTLIINRADRFGLAQLYQIRGRVGRSSAQAYAYLMVPPEGGVTETARKRLLALRQMTELGSGFKVATYDLELRGAGNLLGEEQSGQVTAVGLDLYTQLLDQAVREALGQAPEVVVEPKLVLDLPAYLPEWYLPDVGERLTLYQRLTAARDDAELARLREEMADRFGRVPSEADGLFTRLSLTLLARSLGVERVDTAGPFHLVAFHPQARISADALVALLSRDKRVRFVPPVTLRLEVGSFPTSDDRLLFLEETLRSLDQSARQTAP